LHNKRRNESKKIMMVKEVAQQEKNGRKKIVMVKKIIQQEKE
jgi:hypothetical protein